MLISYDINKTMIVTVTGSNEVTLWIFRPRIIIQKKKTISIKD